MNETIVAETLPDRRQRDRTYREACAVFNGIPDVELDGIVEGLRHDHASAEEMDSESAEVHTNLIEPYLAAATHVQARRLARYRSGIGPNPHGGDYDRWRDLAAEIRRRVDPGELLEADFGVAVVAQGRESGAPCPACGGTDRFRLMPPDARSDSWRCWCRQCRFSCDVIGLYRSLTGRGFFDSLIWLAEGEGLTIPNASRLSVPRSLTIVRPPDGRAS